MDSLKQLFEQGGIMMYPILLCSVLALTIIIERFINLRKAKIIDARITSVLSAINSVEDINVAKNVCLASKGVFANIVIIGLENRTEKVQELRQILNDQGRQEIRSLEFGLVTLETIASVAPLFGLLGTVLGMITLFKVIAEQGTGNPSVLSGGISEALITTVAGLVVGISSLIAYNYFENKANGIISDIEKYSTELVLKLSKL
ncbi:MotA/TolQ/ExbB proton channel family protein [bacterium]|nr:MotA/TolQ/ExbB proton channel family protein [bacterium]